METQKFRSYGDGACLLEVWRVVMRFSDKIGLSLRDIQDLLFILNRRQKMEPPCENMARLEAIIQARLTELQEKK